MKVFIIAGEVSGDKLGAALMTGLKKLVDDVEFQGIGGTLMMSQGMTSLFPMDELSLMGIAEILPKYAHLKRRIAQTADAMIASGADVLITIDSPDFCLRVAKLVRERGGPRIVHYVAPTVWAWRKGRAAKMAKHVDQVLALFPFEPTHLQAAGVRCDFVGHPVVAEPQATKVEKQEFRTRHGIGDAPMVLVLPGSRRGEVGRLSPIFGEVLYEVCADRDDLRIVVPAAGPVAALVKDAVADWPIVPLVLDPSDMTPEDAAHEKRAAFGAADFALAASGTVSLELAAAATPMVIAYDMNWLTREIVMSLLKVDTVVLVNLIAESRTIPEFIGRLCKPHLIAPAVLEVLQNPSAQFDEMAKAMQRLGKGDEDPGLRAARAVLDGMGRPEA